MVIDSLILDDPADMPEDPATIAPETLISVAVWAKLQGDVKPASVLSNRTKSKVRRDTKLSKPGDMPQEDTTIGRSPFWRMSTYRAWEESRPGKGAGAGRPKGSGKGRPRKVELPFTCPHCKHEITGDDLVAESGDANVAANASLRGTAAR